MWYSIQAQLCRRSRRSGGSSVLRRKPTRSLRLNPVSKLDDTVSASEDLGPSQLTLLVSLLAGMSSGGMLGSQNEVRG